MPNVTLSPNMSLPIPTVGLDPGPDWANNINACLSVLDAHNHVIGDGVQIPPSGININADLPFGSNNATLLRSVRMVPQTAALALATDLNVLYSVGANGELYYNDANGNQVQITKTGAVNATSSGISSGSASAAFVAGVLDVLSNVGVSAAIDAGAYILRYSGSYPTPAGNAIVIQAPSSLATEYAYTLPAALPGASGSLLTVATTGQWSYSVVDGATLQTSGGTLSVKTIGASQIASGAITGTQIASNVALAGNAVTAGTRQVVTGNASFTNGLGIVAGIVASAGNGSNVC